MKIFKLLQEFCVIFVMQLIVCKAIGITYVQAFTKGFGYGALYLMIVVTITAFVFNWLEGFRKKA